MPSARVRNRLIGLALGALAAACIIGRDIRRDSGLRWHILPEGEGTIAAIALQYTSNTRETTAPAYHAFLTTIDPSVNVTAVCPDKAAADAFLSDAASWKVANPGRLHTAVVGKTITTWCKDRFLVTGGTPASLLQPRDELSGIAGRNGDASVAPALHLADPARFTTVKTDLSYDAGDFLSTKDSLIVSDSLWNKNGRDPHFLNRLQSQFSSRIVWLHGAPDHHIGMFVAILSNNVALVGDTNITQPLWNAGLNSRLGKADFSPTVAASLTAVQDGLRKAGYRVIKLPTAYLGPKTFISYTNGVFETRNGRQIVYMPWYDEPILDNAACATYESLGCEVHPIPVKTLYRYHGTIGCLINVLRRKQ